jgi:hypothetical protein
MIKEKSPTRGDISNGSPWALISIFPDAFQRRLGHSPSGRGHQALRYRSVNIIALYSHKSIKIIERLTLGLDFSLSHSIPGAARSLYEWPRSPGFTIPLCVYCSTLLLFFIPFIPFIPVYISSSLKR